MFKLGDRIIRLDQDLIIGEGDDAITHPPGNLTSAKYREALGIVEIVEGVRPNDRFYWVFDNGDGTFTKKPKDLASVKQDLLSQIKTTAKALLSNSDWEIVREFEGIKPCSESTKTYRNAVRNQCNTLETSINTCETVEQLEALTISWPELKQ